MLGLREAKTLSIRCNPTYMATNHQGYIRTDGQTDNLRYQYRTLHYVHRAVKTATLNYVKNQTNCGTSAYHTRSSADKREHVKADMMQEITVSKNTVRAESVFYYKMVQKLAQKLKLLACVQRLCNEINPSNKKQ